MSTVYVELSMSLDGFVAGPNDSPENGLGDGGERLFAWYSGGDTALPLPGTDMVFHVTAESAALLNEEWGANTGTMIAGRRMFDIAHAWGGKPPGGGPCIIMTHQPPPEWQKEGSPFTFVTDGVESAIQRARELNGGQDINIASASVTQQCLNRGLLDEIRIDLAPVLLGDGVRLFDRLGTTPIDLELIRTVATSQVTHLRYRVLK